MDDEPSMYLAYQPYKGPASIPHVPGEFFGAFFLAINVSILNGVPNTAYMHPMCPPGRHCGLCSVQGVSKHPGRPPRRPFAPFPRRPRFCATCSPGKCSAAS